jgi:endonuclease G
VINSINELANEIGIANQQNDLKRLKELEKAFIVSSEPSDRQLVAPNVTLDPKKVDVGDFAAESDQVLGIANALSRAKRRITYFRSKWSGIKRPVIISEGDSWFQYPIKLDDVIDVLMKDYQILSLGAAGDLLADMSVRAEYVEAIENENADILLLSGGGNDMLHSGRLRDYLFNYETGMNEHQVFDRTSWETFLRQVKATYRGIFNSMTYRFPRLQIFFHGYDYALPRDGGTWLGGPLAERGVPKKLWKNVVKILIDEFNEVGQSLASEFQSQVTHVDCRGLVGATPGKWFDELHPKDDGYAKIAVKFAEAIESQTSHDGEFSFAESAVITPSRTLRPQGVEAPALTSPLPEAVAHQVYSAVSSLSRPSTNIISSETSSQIMSEAIIDAGKADVGPVLPGLPASLDMRIAEDKSDSSEATETDIAKPVTGLVSTSCTAIHDIIHCILTDGSLPASTITLPTEDTFQPRTNEQLLRMSPCSSLAAWHAHLERDPISIQSYRDFKQVRDEYESEESEDRISTRMELHPQSDLFFQERIIGKSNLEQVNFLSRGQRAARTVGRISVFSQHDIPIGTGSGFLVGPGLLLTNHHVLETIQQADSGSYILFNYEYDADNRLKTTERFDFSSDLFFTDKDLDFTFVAVAMTGSGGTDIREFGALRLIEESGKALKGEPVSILQHPSGLPKQIAIRDSTVVGRKGDFIYYYADTLGGSSGSPVLTDQWFPVALHHRSVPDVYNPCKYVANRGIRISSIYARLRGAAYAGDEMAESIIERLEQPVTPPSQLTTSVGSSTTSIVTEAMVEPFHELPYDNRSGYDQDFLGSPVPMPMVIDPDAIAAPRIDTTSPKFLLKYEHFSLVMHKERRLAIFTAANVDSSAAKKKPEAGKEYGRKALAGLGENDREKWFMDPRISSAHQLPDKFFQKDRQSFDRGHVVMRAEVAWGESYDELRRANGDTYHTTNCSPQVKEFNRAAFGFQGLWGQLENIVLAAAKSEKLCVFAGPILSVGDTEFKGKGIDGDILVKIPSSYWKVIFAKTDSGIESFAFILEQDLSGVEFDPDEFGVTGEWATRRTTIDEIESKSGILKFG